MSTHPFSEIRALTRCGARLPSHLEQEILALGDAAVDPLRGVLADRAGWLVNSEGGGHAPIHAARLLGRLRAERALPDLMDALAHTEPMEILYSTLVHALTELGPVVVEPLLALAASTDDADALDAAAEVLSRVGVRDDRIFALLLEQLAAKVHLGAGFLAAYGDPGALPHLHVAFAKYEVTDDDLVAPPAVELAAAIEDLGGKLTRSEQDKYEEATGGIRAFRDAMLAALATKRRDRATLHTVRRTRPKLGRNDNCWCGSGRKYKHCHYRADREPTATA